MPSSLRRFETWPSENNRLIAQSVAAVVRSKMLLQATEPLLGPCVCLGVPSRGRQTAGDGSADASELKTL